MGIHGTQWKFLGLGWNMWCSNWCQNSILCLIKPKSRHNTASQRRDAAKCRCGVSAMISRMARKKVSKGAASGMECKQNRLEKHCFQLIKHESRGCVAA